MEILLAAIASVAMQERLHFRCHEASFLGWPKPLRDYGEAVHMVPSDRNCNRIFDGYQRIRENMNTGIWTYIKSMARDAS